MTRLTVADATDHPKLFRQTYWGNFALGDEVITPDIYANRNKLVQEWKLTRAVEAFIPRPALPPRCDFDHPEVYRDRDGGIVLVVSNYNGPPPRALGMQHVDQVYSTATQSYLRRFDSIKELREALR